MCEIVWSIFDPGAQAIYKLHVAAYVVNVGPDIVYAHTMGTKLLFTRIANH